MKIEIISKKVICENAYSNHRYAAWPSVTRLKNGRLAMVTSAFRLGHIDPFGKGVICFSEDEGQTWSLPAPVIDTPNDDRDCGIVAFGESSVMVNSFNISPGAMRKYRKMFYQDKQEPCMRYWDAYLDMIEEKEEWQEHCGVTCRFSHDNGITWGEIGTLPVTSPHGPAELPDGSLLYVGLKPFTGSDDVEDCSQFRLCCYQVHPDGTSTFLCDIENPDPEDIKDLNGANYIVGDEPHAIVLKNGKIIVHMRTEPFEYTFAIYQSESMDGGKSFTKPHRLLPWKGGSPAHLIEDNGTLISVYGYREDPCGIRVMFSKDEGETWDINHILADDEPDLDCGYPASVVLKDGSILTVYYGKAPDMRNNVIKQIIWRYSAD